MRAGPYKRLSAEELMPLNCGAGEALEGLLDNRKVKPVHPEGNQA